MTPDPRPLVVMTCGVAGSGKTTLARRRPLAPDPRVEPAELRRRLAERAARRDADAAFEITDDLLAAHLAGEAPYGKGEEVLTPADVPTWRPR